MQEDEYRVRQRLSKNLVAANLNLAEQSPRGQSEAARSSGLESGQNSPSPVREGKMTTANLFSTAQTVSRLKLRTRTSLPVNKGRIELYHSSHQSLFSEQTGASNSSNSETEEPEARVFFGPQDRRAVCLQAKPSFE
jgi:hypothetical protein